MPAGLPHMTGYVKEVYSNLYSVTSDFIVYLEIPPASEYWSSLRIAARDATAATKSMARVGHLTLRPVVLLLLLLSKGLWIVFQFLAIHLFRHAYISMKHGYVQVKFATKWLIQWQRSLSRTAILMELAIFALLIGCYLLRRYIQKKKYVERTARWYRRRKRVVTMKYNRLVRRVSQTSLFLAMLLPHVLFVGAAASVKIVLPRLVSWLACDTLATSVLSLWYPFLWTVSLLHQWRHLQHDEKAADASPRSSTRTASTPSSGTRSGLYPKTTPKRDPKSPAVQRWLRAATPSMRRGQQGDRPNEGDLDLEAHHWLKYWVVYALFNAACRMFILIPLVGGVLSRQSLASFLLELKLVFFIWIFCLPTLVVAEPSMEYESRPLELLYHRFSAVARSIYQHTSNAIPAGLWESLVSKLQSLLDALVFIKFVSSDTKERIIHIVQESASLIPPAVTLFMPGFITEYGVIYVKSIVPSAKSLVAAEATESTMLLLEYWVLHCVLHSVLQWWSPILWWIPFSTHFCFVLWCYLAMPKTTSMYYNLWEEELMAFGLLARPDSDQTFELEFERTMTARALRTLYRSLPSAAEDEEQEREDDNVEGEKEEVVRHDDSREKDDEPTEGDNPTAEFQQNASDDSSSDREKVRAQRRGSGSSGDSNNSGKVRRSLRRRRKPLQQLY